MRILVCGSRHYAHADQLFTILDKEVEDNPNEQIEIINGAAPGADKLSTYWAISRSRPYREFPALWNLHGKAAGPIRNKQMLDEGKPDLVIAFLAPNSRGTKNMIEQSQKAGIPVKIINISAESPNTTEDQF